MQIAKSEQETEDSIAPFDNEISSMNDDDQAVEAKRKDDKVVEIPHTNSHIDFVVGDQQWKLGDEEQLVRDCDLMVRLPHVITSKGSIAHPHRIQLP